MRGARAILVCLLGCSPHGTEPPPRDLTAAPPKAQSPKADVPFLEGRDVGAASDPNAHRRFSDLRREDLGDGLPQGPAGAAPSSAPPFDRHAAALALGSVDLAPCIADAGVRGEGHVIIVFAGDGSVSSARIDRPPFEATPEGGCIAGLFARVHIPPFGGRPVTVGKAFTR